MRKAGIVKGEKRGYWTHYAVEKGALELVAERFSQAANQAGGAQSASLRVFPMASNAISLYYPADPTEICMASTMPSSIVGGTDALELMATRFDYLANSNY